VDNGQLTQELLLCQLNDLEEQQCMEMLVEGRQLFAVRADNSIHAYWNICPHMGIPLNWVPNRYLDYDKAFIQCSSHGAQFQVATENDYYYICANQSLPATPVNLRALALADLEDRE
jgi:nitrite reductase/ring-hydroxylating ferredoxin subunit